MGYIDETTGKWKRGRNMRTQLREVSAVRTVGFQDAVDDLGTHIVHGRAVPYTRNAVYAVLRGTQKSQKLLRIIAQKRPDLFTLRYVCEEVREWFAKQKEAI